MRQAGAASFNDSTAMSDTLTSGMNHIGRSIYEDSLLARFLVTVM